MKDLKLKRLIWLGLFLLLVVISNLSPVFIRPWLILPGIFCFAIFLGYWSLIIEEWKLRKLKQWRGEE